MEQVNEKWYELRNAVYLKDYAEAESLLKSMPELISLTNSIGETVLHFLAVENDIEGVEWLHSRKFDINTKNDFGEPVIFEVASLGYKDLLMWFYNHGADFLATNEEGDSLLDYLKKIEKTDMENFIREHCKS